MRKLTPEEKQALEEKLKEEGLDEERGKQTKKTPLTDEEKEAMKKMIAQAEHERLGRLDKMMHSREKKRKKVKE